MLCPYVNIIDYGLLQALTKNKSIRSYHSTPVFNNNNNNNDDNIDEDIIKNLYANRVAKTIEFSEKVLISCSNILDLGERKEFFNKLKEIPHSDKGGIYIFQYKYDSKVYYIGRTSSFDARFKTHIIRKVSDKFHVFGNIVGWDKFNISVIEICDRNEQGKRENFYLQKYLPLLNSTFNSNFSESSIYESLRSILKLKQEAFNKVNNEINTYSTLGKKIWVYKYNEGASSFMDEKYECFASSNETSKVTGLARDTINRYLNTNVPIKGLLLYSEEIKDLSLVLNLVSESKTNLSDVEAKPVWIYTVDENNPNKSILINNAPFKSRELAAKFLKTSHSMVRYYMDSWDGKGYKGNYLFSKQLTDKDFNSLLKLWLLENKPNKIQVWVYDANTFMLINNSPFSSMQSCAKYFNIDYRTVSNNLDTKLAVLKNNLLVYFFSKELDKITLQEISLNPQKAKHNLSEVWVYNKSYNQYTLFNENQPFVSKLQASKELGISAKTITKYMDSNSDYKGFYFFSVKQ